MMRADSTGPSVWSWGMPAERGELRCMRHEFV